MQSTSSDASKVLHKSSCKIKGSGWFFSTARLFSDRIEFSGWTWKGRQKRVVSLDSVADVKWKGSVHKVENFALLLHDEQPLRLWMKGPGLWKYQIEAEASNLAPQPSQTKKRITHAA